MYTFSFKSIKELQTCHPDLQRIMLEAIKHIDFTVVCGHRGKADQEKAYREGRSQLDWPKSKHNTYPSLAVDLAPYYPTKPNIRWDDHAGFIYLAGMIKGIAAVLGFKIRWGGDWDQDNDQKDEKFRDLPHFELVL